ncbi:MAG: response regulator [Myxococcales bacterium]
MNPLEQIEAVFRAEVTELLDALGQGVESLPATAAAERRKPLEKCMRLAHNVKGISASVGFTNVQRLAHAAETTLGALMAAGDRLIERECQALLRSVTAMQQLAQGAPMADEELATLLAGLGAQAPAAPSIPAAPASPIGPAAAPPSPAPSVHAGAPEPTNAKPSPAEAPAMTSARASVRVETSRLDRLMDYAGELLTAHARLVSREESLGRFRHTLEEKVASLPLGQREAMLPVVRQLEHLSAASRRELDSFGRLARDLGSAMKQVRMMPLSGLASSWRQLVRESAERLDRRVELVTELGEIEVDRYVLDRVRDPLIHLLRNAVAHGIEPAAERQRAAKPPVGKVLVRAEALGTQVRLEVLDDGAGLDPVRLGESAQRKGLVSAEQRAGMTSAELLDLIFADGFSTAEAVGEVSGRGVGLGVVRSNVAGLGGSLTVSPRSALGGAGFVVTLPVSVVSRRGLLVRAGEGVYALPIEHVQRTVRVDAKELQGVDGERIASTDAGPLRVRWLAQEMGGAEAAVAGRVKVVVVECGEVRLGLAVDEVLREEEYVVKRLPAHLGEVPGVDGALVLADGALAVAVNLGELTVRAARRAAPAPAQRSPSPAAAGAPQRARVLVVDDMLTTRALHRSALESAGLEVVLAADGEEAWQALSRESFDVLVSDVQMPRLDGFGLTARVRRDPDPTLSALPVVLVTALGSPEEVAAGASAGANEYLVKGRYDPQALVDAVRRYLHG